MNDFTCDLNCPVIAGISMPMTCCQHCKTARQYYVTDDNKHLWTEDKGFLGEQGCRLTRKNMPPECRSYDCKDEIFYACYVRYAPFVWHDGQWAAVHNQEIFLVGSGAEGAIPKLMAEIQRRIEQQNQQTWEEYGNKPTPG